jgi:endonuclease/exonuclease/phosphatase (EEP) superfamily protein YafD
VLVVPCAVWALVRLFGLERGWPWVQLMSFTPYVATATAVVAAAALLIRRWTAGAVAVVAAVSLCAVVVPRAIPDGRSTANGPVLRVLTVNLMGGSAHEAAVLDLVRRLSVDVLALQEFTPDGESGLRAAGVADALPHAVSYPRPGVGGSALLSRYPVRNGSARGLRGGAVQARATVDVPGAAPVEVESVHPAAPWGAPGMANWERDLRDQPPATVDGLVRVLLGDFNATLDHASLRRLVATGYRDAASAAGSGLRPTWPSLGRKLTPPVTLDRVLADRRVGVRAARPYRVTGTDHRAVYAELVLPGRTGSPI